MYFRMEWMLRQYSKQTRVMEYNGPGLHKAEEELVIKTNGQSLCPSDGPDQPRPEPCGAPLHAAWSSVFVLRTATDESIEGYVEFPSASGDSEAIRDM